MAGQLLLSAAGTYSTTRPTITLFNTVQHEADTELRETFEIPFDNSETFFGSRSTCTIPKRSDILTGVTLRAILPPIYPVQSDQYVYPTPSSQVGGTVYADMTLTQVVANGVTLTANTSGNHYFSVGAQVKLTGTKYIIFNLDGTYTIASIPTADSFTCSTALAGVSYNGIASVLGIVPSDVVSYFSTVNSNLWVNNLTNKTWQVTNAAFNGPGTELTVTTSSSSGFSVGQNVDLIISSLGIDGVYTVIASTDTTFTVQFLLPKIFMAISYTNTPPSGFMTSTDGQEWTQGTINQSQFWYDIAFGNGTTVVSGHNATLYSTDYGQTWNVVVLDGAGNLYGVAFGNGVFVAVGSSGGSGHAYYSTNNGKTWTPVSVSGSWSDITFGDGTFVAVGGDGIMLSNDNGQTWSFVIPGVWSGVAFGNGTFAVVGNSGAFESTNNGVSWTPAVDFMNGYSITFGNDIFVSSGYYALSFGNNTFVGLSSINSEGVYFSINNGDSWTFVSISGTWLGVVFTNYIFNENLSDLVKLTVPPLQLTNRVFSSTVYPSISFANTEDAAFWGFDSRESREGLTYALPATPPWTLTQSGWISGFLPPSTSTYDDSVAHKLCKAVRVLVGKQTIKEYSGEYIELQNDLMVPYENKAILKLMNGTLDQTQATVAREYYVNLPLGTKEVPLCALTHQHMSVEVDFDSYLNVSQNLNQGTGDFLDAKSYTTYDASTGLLGGQPVDVQTTFSYQQYIFIVTYGGQFIIYDTTKNVDDPASYIVLSAFSGSSLFSQFCVLSGNLYIGLTNGQLARMIITELIQGNISSFVVNNYTPTIGSLTGTIVADFRYVYYTVSNTVTSNVFLSRYDTTGTFTNPSNYTSFDFTSNIDSTVTFIYQIISTGSQLIALTNTPGQFYIFNLNGNFTLSWNSVNYSMYASQITEGVLIGSTLYFTDKYSIITYSEGIFKSYVSYAFVATGGNSRMYSIDNGKQWVYIPVSYAGYSICFGNKTFVTTTGYNATYSENGGQTWNQSSTPLNCSGVAFGNGRFVTVGYFAAAYSDDNAQTWISSVIQPNANLGWIAFGNNTFVAVGFYYSVYSLDNGQTWSDIVYTPVFSGNIAFGNGTFVIVGYYATAYSLDNGQTWSGSISVDGQFYSIAYGNNTFVAVGEKILYSTDNGQSWLDSTPFPGLTFRSVSFGNGTFVAVRGTKTIYSTDNGITWTDVAVNDYWYGVAFGDLGIVNIPGDGLQNLHAVGSKIYASSNSSTVSSVIEIDTSADLNSSGAYKFYSSTDSTAPIAFAGTAPKIFANGPRFVYMFAQGDNSAKNIVRYDPYPPITTLQASILVDYKSSKTKPKTAFLPIVQSQKVTNMERMDIRRPVKELWLMGATSGYQYSNLASQCSLLINNEPLLSLDVGTQKYLKTIQPFETHTSMPIRNFSVLSFELDPESSKPNGTINFSRIHTQQFTGGATHAWASTYNILVIKDGMGGLMFN